MCGIAGIVNLDKKKIAENVLGEMTNALAHRGPDGRGIFVERGLGARIEHRASFALVSNDPNAADAGIELVLGDGRRLRISPCRQKTPIS